jgi:hypothetical protein
MSEENKPNRALLYKALAKAQAAVRHATLDSTNPHFRSKYASLESCLDAIKKPMADNELFLIQTVITKDEEIVLETILGHGSGEDLRFHSPIILTKKDMQGLGSSTTYARRYSLCGLFSIGADEDDDANYASLPPQKTIASAPRGVVDQTHASCAPKTKGPTEAQIKRLYAIASSSGWSHASCKRYMQEHFNVDSSTELSREQYDSFCTDMQTSEDPYKHDLGNIPH